MSQGPWWLNKIWQGVRAKRLTGLHVSGDPTLATATVGSVTTVAMADAAHTLLLAPSVAGAAQTVVKSNVIFCDPDSGGASEILTLPPVASSTGLWLLICNTGGEGIVVKDVAANTIITLDTAQHGIVACNGTSWIGFMGAVT
jgi:hypothetical protein